MKKKEGVKAPKARPTQHKAGGGAATGPKQARKTGKQGGKEGGR